MVVFYGGRKSKKSAPYMLMLMMLVILPLTVGLACDTGTPAATTPVATATQPPGGTQVAGSATVNPAATSTAVAALTPLAVPCATPTESYLGDWKITHYNYAMENDTQFPANDKVPVSGLDQSKTYRRQFIYSPAGIYGQGTGLAEDGTTYITIDHTTNAQLYGPDWINTDPSPWYFIYGKGGAFAEGKPWASVAIAQGETQLRYGDKVKISLYPDKIFEVTDTGTFPDTSHLDVFIGPDTYAHALELGTKFNISVWKVIGGG